MLSFCGQLWWCHIIAMLWLIWLHLRLLLLDSEIFNVFNKTFNSLRQFYCFYSWFASVVEVNSHIVPFLISAFLFIYLFTNKRADSVVFTFSTENPLKLLFLSTKSTQEVPHSAKYTEITTEQTCCLSYQWRSVLSILCGLAVSVCVNLIAVATVIIWLWETATDTRLWFCRPAQVWTCRSGPMNTVTKGSGLSTTTRWAPFHPVTGQSHDDTLVSDESNMGMSEQW